MPFIGNTATGAKIRHQNIYGDGVRRIFNLEFLPSTDQQFLVYYNGVYVHDVDYVLSGAKILFSTIPDSGTLISIVSMANSDVKQTRNKLYVGDGVTRIFDLGWTPPTEQSVLVAVNGEMLNDYEYVVQGHKCLLIQAPTNNTLVEFRGLHDIVDNGGNSLASNPLTLNTTGLLADGQSNIFPIHHRPTSHANLMVTANGTIKDNREYLLVDGKVVFGTRPAVGTYLEFKGFQSPDYTNYERRTQMTDDAIGIPSTITLGAGGTGYTTGTYKTTGGGGYGLLVDVTASGGVVTAVSITANQYNFAKNYVAGNVLTIASGNTNATLTVTAITNNTGQRYFDFNAHRWDSVENIFINDTSYILDDAKDLFVSIDGILQPYTEYTVLSRNFYDTDNLGNIAQVVDVGSYVGDHNFPAKVEIRDLKKIYNKSNSVTNANTDIQRCVWTVTTNNATTFDVAAGYTSRTSDFTASMTSNAAKEDLFMVVINGVIQRNDTWSISGSVLTLAAHDAVGMPVSSSNDADGLNFYVELIYFQGVTDTSCYDCTFLTTSITGTPGVGGEYFYRLFDQSNTDVEVHPDSDHAVIVTVNGVLQHDDSYYVVNNKLCFDEQIQAGSEIWVKVLKATPVLAANRRRAYFIGDGSVKTFTLPYTPTSTPDDNGIIVNVDGTVLNETQFSLNGNVLTLATAPASLKKVDVIGIYDITTFTGTISETNNTPLKITRIANGTDNIYQISELVFENNTFGTIQETYNEQKILVYINGKLQNSNSYIINGNKVYFGAIPPLNAVIELVRFI